MKKLKNMIEGIDEIVESVGNNSKDKASAFFNHSIMPDGSSWREKIRPEFKVDNDVKITKSNNEILSDGSIAYEARLHFTPGRGGGAGVTVDSMASNQLFNELGTDRNVIRQVSKGFSAFTKRNQRGVNAQVVQWLKLPENFMHNIVGMNKNKNYIIKDVILKSIKYDNPIIDPARRQWPSGRTEIFQPVWADVRMIIKPRSGK